MALEDVLVGAVVRPVYVGLLDFKDDPVRGWTGPGTFAPVGTGDDDLDGQAFVDVAGAIEISEFGDNQSLGSAITITFAAGDMDDEEIIQQLVADRRLFQTRKAKIWQFFLNSDESTVLPEFQVMFNGIMTHASTERQPGEPAKIMITCDQDLQKARVAPVRWIDHQVFYSGDTATTFVNNLARGSLAGAQRVTRSTNQNIWSTPWDSFNARRG